MTQPKVSIIIPVYNVEAYLRQCLESVLDQTLGELEIIILDDGSTDASPQIIDYYASKDSRIKAVHKENEGYGATCNRGFDIAQGEYVGIVESDDFVASKMYEELYAYAKRMDADVVKGPYYDYFLELPPGVTAQETLSPGPNLDGYLKAYVLNPYLSSSMPVEKTYSLRECPCQLAAHQSIWAGIYRRDYLIENKVRFMEVPGAGHVDIKFCVDSLRYSEKLAWLDKAFYCYRVGRDGSSTGSFNLKENLQRYHEMQDELKQEKELFDICAPYLASREMGGLLSYFGLVEWTDEDVESMHNLLCDFSEGQLLRAPAIDADSINSALAFRKDLSSAKKQAYAMSHKTAGSFMKQVVQEVGDRGWFQVAVLSALCALLVASLSAGNWSSFGVFLFVASLIVFILSGILVLAFPLRRVLIMLRSRD